MTALGLFDNRGKQGDEDDAIVTEGIADLLDGMDLAPTMPMPVVGDRDGDDASGDAPDEGRNRARRLRKALEEIVLGKGAPDTTKPAAAPAGLPVEHASATAGDAVESAAADNEELPVETPIENLEITTSSLTAPDEQSQGEAQSGPDPEEDSIPETEAMPPMSEQDKFIMAPFRLELDEGDQTPVESIASSLACIAECMRDMRDDIRALRNHICSDEGEAGGRGADELAEEPAVASADDPDDTAESGDGQEILPDALGEDGSDDWHPEDDSEGEAVEDDEDEPLGDGDAPSVMDSDDEAEETAAR